MAARKPTKAMVKAGGKTASLPKAEDLDKHQLPVPKLEGHTKERSMAEVTVAGVAGNAHIADVFATFSGIGGNSIGDCVDSLRGHIDRAKTGDLAGPEALLVSQAFTLNSIFTEMARRAAVNLGHNPDTVDRYLRLAFKAQAQSRCAVEALSEMKNPRQPVFAKQANIANGHQQVNNGSAVTLAGETVSPPNKLLEVQDAEWVDAGEARAAARGNPDVAAVDTRNRAKNGRGEGVGRSQRVEGR